MVDVTIGNFMPKLINGILNMLSTLLVYLESPFVIYNNSGHFFSIVPLNIQIDTTTIDFIFDIPSFEISMLSMLTTSLLIIILCIGIIKFFINIFK